jgi:hypothetical protein
MGHPSVQYALKIIFGFFSFPFQAKVVETSVAHAATLCECFYSLGDPKLVERHYRYTRKYHFIPFVKSKECPVPKI